MPRSAEEWAKEILVGFRKPMTKMQTREQWLAEYLRTYAAQETSKLEAEVARLKTEAEQCDEQYMGDMRVVHALQAHDAFVALAKAIDHYMYRLVEGDEEVLLATLAHPTVRRAITET